MTTVLAVLDWVTRPLVWTLHHLARPLWERRPRKPAPPARRPSPGPQHAARPAWPPKPLRADCDRRPAFPELRAEDHALVRPYVLHAEERRRQRQRRRALLPATVGIDTGPHIIHGVRVRGAAR